MIGEPGSRGPIRSKGAAAGGAVSGSSIGDPKVGQALTPCNRKGRICGWKIPGAWGINALAVRNGSAADTGQNFRGAMIRILLAEDDESMRLYLSRALERVGYAVVAVDRGTAALPLLEAEQFDLLLTDIVMPEMDGIELAQKAALIAPTMRVMFITGFAAVALKAGKASPDAKVLSKPFHLRDLVAEVDRMFQSEDQHGRL
jgi:two-component system cell cycle response regulator CpdR